MIRTNKKNILLFLCLTVIYTHLTGQEASVIQFVNPLIGTSNTQTPSLWGSEGGTYPGAVSPFGFLQLTPETRNGDSKGYNYKDNSILYFSCINHPTGYPDGSSGRIRVMPLDDGRSVLNGKYERSFTHLDEEATAGYYSVLFRDNGTKVEVSAAERSGMFRFTFPPNSKPRIFLGDLGSIQTISKRVLSGTTGHAILSFSMDYTHKEEVAGGCIVTFPTVEQGKEVLILKIGVSPVDFESTLNNLRFEADDWDFNQFKAQNQRKWNKALSVITIEDSSIINKTVFYTALYHSMLMPWIISDFLGNYRGADNLIHKTKGKNQYGGFSAWDTFRSLHPLLCLIAPDRQKDMVLSMLAHFEQSGSLPLGPMTGNHVIPIIVDSYFKGINGFDKALAFKAMKSCLVVASGSLDFSAYRQLGYVPSSCSESVTKTVEFAYDDWALAQFAGKVMNDQDEFNKLLNRSLNYRNLFSPAALALLPRLEKNFNLDPGNSGYKEGDQWSYSLFVPQNPRDLINLTGGDQEFAARTDTALTNQFILFDNEPVLHVPYLFNYANRPDLSQKWVRNIMKTHYTNSPFGLPGNDDHGAMSSWYVFSAMGFYPVCPGRPVYDLGSPLFKKITINLQNGKKWIVNSKNNGPGQPFVRSTLLNGKPLNTGWISHSSIVQGGDLTFEMDKIPMCVPLAPDFAPSSETTATPDFKITGFYRFQKEVAPDQLFYIPFMVQNKGGKGTMIIRLFADGKEINKKNLLISENSTAFDSIGCRLYAVGTRMIRIDQLSEHPVDVIQQKAKTSPSVQILELTSRRIYKAKAPLEYSFTMQNSGGLKLRTTLPVWADEVICEEEVVTLEPGEIRQVMLTVTFKKEGIHRLQVGSKSHQIKIYSENSDSKVMDLTTGNKVIKDTLTDQSGLLNRALIHRNDGDRLNISRGIETDSVNFAEIFKSESLDKLDQKITVMAWVKPTKGNHSLSDIITKGDFIALQASGNKTLSWFAGGWGRGSCSANLPANWLNNWHHIAGVADGKILKIYIDGVESGGVTIDQSANLTCSAKWMIGRNEEFPDQRFFNGFVNHFKIFVEPLTETEIKSEMLRGKPMSE